MNSATSSLDAEQHATVLESTSTHDGEYVTQGRRKRLRKKTSDPVSPKAKQQKSSSVRSVRVNLQQTSSQNDASENPPKPPKIYVRKVTDYKAFCTKLCGVAGADNFHCRSRFNDIAISTLNSDAYRAVVHYLRKIEADFHCYQLPEDKTYRVVIRNLHFSTPPSDISEDLTNKGYKVINVINIRHPTTKAQLPLFYVDLEKTEKSREIFKEKYLLWSEIRVEEPRRRNDIVQCHQCQEYNHSKKYCHHKPRCVKCGDQHFTKDCPRPVEIPASCANCGKNHPANYRGCEVYKALKTLKNQRVSQRPQPVYVAPPTGSAHFPSLPPSASLQPSSSLVRPNETYASLLHSSQKKQPSSSSKTPNTPHPKTPSLPPAKPHPFEQPSLPQRQQLPNRPRGTSSITPDASDLPGDFTTLISTLLNRLESMITPLISLMTSFMTEILPKLLK